MNSKTPPGPGPDLLKSPANLLEARAIQEAARPLVETRTRVNPVKRVAGVDVGFENRGKIARGAVTVLTYPRLEPLTQAIARREVEFPYIPGFLSFREVPVLLDALDLIEAHLWPDVILCDSQGLAHPRRFGLACHLGVVTDTASIGVAKSRLIGAYEEPATERGSWSDLMHDDQRIGRVVRTRAGTRPLFVSIGHRVSLRKAVNIVLKCSPRYRLPETTRQAHRLASG